MLLLLIRSRTSGDFLQSHELLMDCRHVSMTSTSFVRPLIVKNELDVLVFVD